MIDIEKSIEGETFSRKIRFLFVVYFLDCQRILHHRFQHLKLCKQLLLIEIQFSPCEMTSTSFKLFSTIIDGSAILAYTCHSC